MKMRAFLSCIHKKWKADPRTVMQNYEKQVAEVLKAHPAVDKVIAMSSYSEYRKGAKPDCLKTPRPTRSH